MRVALIRGSLMRSWELPNYEMDGVAVEPVVSRGVLLGPPAERFRLRRLPCAADLTARLGPRAFGAFELLAGSPEYLWGLGDVLGEYDIAHALELTYPFTRQAVRARAGGKGPKVVATVMENIPFKPHPNRLVAARANEVAAGVDRFIAITDRARLHLRSAGVPEDRITVMPLGIDVDTFHPRREARRSGPTRLLSVARLEPAKGVEDVVIAAGLLAEQGHDLELSLVGAGPLGGRLRRIAAAMGIGDRVELLAVPWPELPQLYRDHDIFVLASAATRWWQEQFGFAVVEAMASGLPVRVGGSGSLPEVVGREDALVRPHDPPALAQALAPLIEDEELRSEAGALSRERALGHYDRRLIGERLKALYQQVLAAPRA